MFPGQFDRTYNVKDRCKLSITTILEITTNTFVVLILTITRICEMILIHQIVCEHLLCILDSKSCVLELCKNNKSLRTTCVREIRNTTVARIYDWSSCKRRVIVCVFRFFSNLINVSKELFLILLSNQVTLCL